MAEIARIELDPAEPPVIARDVTIPTARGARVLPVRYRYRDRQQLAELFDSYNERAEADRLREQSRTLAEPAPSIREMEAANIEADVLALLDVLEGWGLGLPFTADNLRKMCVQHPAAAFTIVEDYRSVMTKGRLGN